MKYSYCTLFDSNYLDKGLVLIDSLINCTPELKLYILAMDDVCYKVLSELKNSCVTVISLKEFEDERYAIARANRSFSEYCWTCSAGLISYVMDVYGYDVVTYIDADMYFYSNPNELIDKMIKNNKSVLIVAHGFSKSLNNQLVEETGGKYCVEFNSFRNTDEGKIVLKKWQEQTLVSCACNDEIHGDQKYLDVWPDEYDSVFILDEPGAGVAPWNINRFNYISEDYLNDGLRYDKKNKVKLYFFHFENINYITENKVRLNVYGKYWHIDSKLVRTLYIPYLTKLSEKKTILNEKYHIKSLIKVHPSFANENSDNKEPLIPRKYVNDPIKCVWYLINLFSLHIKSALGRRKDIVYLPLKI